VTDAWLMEADCIHGVAWYDCATCGEELAAMLEAIDETDIDNISDWP
jgi:hypothetical protein